MTTIAQLARSLDNYGDLRPVVARTPHGSYTFNVVGVTTDRLDPTLVVLNLEEVPPPPPSTCRSCGAPETEWPTIFRGSGLCSDLCRKAAAK